MNFDFRCEFGFLGNSAEKLHNDTYGTITFDSVEFRSYLEVGSVELDGEQRDGG